MIPFSFGSATAGSLSCSGPGAIGEVFTGPHAPGGNDIHRPGRSFARAANKKVSTR